MSGTIETTHGSVAPTLEEAQLTDVIRSAADEYVYRHDGLVVPCPLVPAGKVGPDYFQAVAGTAHSILDIHSVEGDHTSDSDYVDASSALLQRTLRTREIGVDCSGFVTSVLSRGLGKLAIDPFEVRIPHNDFDTGYLIPGHELDNSPEATAKANLRQEKLENGELDSETKNDYDIQRLVDNSDPLEAGEPLKAGDLVVYDPSDLMKDPYQLGHVALITRVKSGRAKIVHSGGANTPGVQSMALPVQRLSGNAPDAKTSVTVRRLHALKR